jgi:hypothetical protein
MSNPISNARVTLRIYCDVTLVCVFDIAQNWSQQIEKIKFV